MHIPKILLIIGLLLQPLFGKELKVVATHSVIADWVQNIAGDSIALSTLVPANTDNHTFEATPKDAAEISSADIIFENGFGLEYWLDKLYTASNSKAQRIRLSQDIQPISTHTCPCHHGDYDPHFWLSVPNAITATNTIYHTLSKINPKWEALYKKNLIAYQEELRALDKFIIEKTNALPKKNRKLITNHDAFQYFAKQYGFKILGSSLGSSTTESLDPSAAHFVKLKKLIKDNHLKAIFGENIQNNAVTKELALECKLPQPPILYSGALSEASGPANSYINLMRYNTLAITNNLR